MRSICRRIGGALLRARVRIGARVEQEPDQVEHRRAVDAVFERSALSTSMLRVSTAAQSGVRPYQSLTLTSAPLLDQEARDVRCGCW